METIRKVYNIIHKARVTAIVLLLIFIIAICTVNIVLRYLVSRVDAIDLRPYSWVDEIMRMLVIWVAFLAASLGAKENSHVSLESIVKKYLPDNYADILRKIASIIVLVVLALLIYFGISQTINARMSYLQNLPITNAWFYAAIPVGCFYLFIDYLLIFIFGEHPFSSKMLAADKADKE
ncbi:MAG: TRAP transporter small permease [Caldicoprobacterales bacterium]|jgi:TRAP-type C4-dicarboxylate transport system permease small subunit|nr:TRAP transporter small permease subunit [Clostridiales bacterium]